MTTIKKIETVTADPALFRAAEYDSAGSENTGFTN